MANTPTDAEQLMLELINRLRTDPAGEYDALTAPEALSEIQSALTYFGVNLGALQTQLAAFSPVAPLAWNSPLADAAQSHSAAMIAGDSQSHQLPGEPGLGTRATNAGYGNWSTLGENIYAFAETPVYGHAGFVVDWGYDNVDFESDGTTLKPNWQSLGDGMQDPPGHRNNMLSGGFTEIGIDVTTESDPGTSVGPLVITQDLGNRFNYQAQFVGVVIDDTDNDDVYDVGEGLGGVTVQLTSSSGNYQTTTWSSGGWQIAVPAGTYAITFSGAGLGGTVSASATIGSANVKLDVEAADAHAAFNLVEGDGGNNTLAGTAGVDHIYGFAGDDILIGGTGEDQLFGGDGVDTASYAGDEGAVFVNLTLGRGYGNASFGDTYDGIENVTGTDYNDFLIGDPGVNRLDGGAGDDTIIGAVGPDELIGGSGLDWASYEDNSGTVFVNLTLKQGYNNAAHGDTYDGIENVIGGLMDDFFIGDEAANRLNGAMGADTLLGAGGADIFMFTYAPGATSTWGHANADLILDFASGVDTIELAASAFPGLAAGTLPASAFVLGTAAADASDRILYDQATGNLFFDPDGTGGQAATLFATLGETSHPLIAASDFAVV